MDTDEKRRTIQQNKALHKWFADIARTLNEHGADMQATLEALDVVDAPWTAASVKEVIFKPLLAQIAGVESTADASTTDYTPVMQAMNKAFAQALGITLPPWPRWDREPEQKTSKK